jgi:hypothetical protein
MEASRRLSASARESLVAKDPSRRILSYGFHGSSAVCARLRALLLLSSAGQDWIQGPRGMTPAQLHASGRA